jgi:type I restriction enzyme S subunit
LVTPAGWKEVRLGDLLGYEQPTKYLVSSSDYVEGGQVPVLTAGKSFLLGYTDDTDGIYTNLPTIIFDDFTTATQWVDFEFKVKSSACKMLRPKNGVCNPRYVFERLRALNYQTSDHKRHWISVFHSMEMLMPPLKEQEAIAEALSDADAAIESLDALIAKKRDVKQATMQQLLTGRTRLPGFTVDWKEVRLGDVGSLRGGTGFPLRFQGRKSGEVPFYKVSDMNLSGNEIQMFDSNNWISEGDSRVIGAAPFPKGSIVFAKVGAAVFLERKRILTRPSCIDNNMMAIVPDASCMDVRFLHFALQMVRFGDLVSATALPSINASGVAGISLALPSLKEQEAIAEALTVMDDELEALTEQAFKLRMVKQGMMQDLLTGKVRLM